MFKAEQFTELARTAHDPEAAEKMAAILNDELDPETIEAVEDHVRQMYNKPDSDHLKMLAFDALFDLHGIEAIRVEGEWVDNYHGDIVATYCNTGDTYALTLLHESETGALVLTSYGDWLEAWEQENRGEPSESLAE